MAKTLFKSTFAFSSMTMLSRVFGLVRDIVVAHVFGASAGLDAFFVAFKIPNFMRRLFAEGAFSQAFVPVLSEYSEKRSEAEAKQFVDRVAGTLFVALFCLTVVAVLITPILVVIFAPGYVGDPHRFHLTAIMLRITFPYLLLISLTAFAGAVLNTYRRFAVPAFTPVLLNLSMIGTAVLLSPHLGQPVEALAWGVFLGGVVQLAFQIPFLRRVRMLPRPRWGWRDAGVRRVLKLMVPALFGVSVVQVGLLIDTLFATFLPVGSVTWLYFSERLTFLPLGVFGVAIATVVLPHLSRKHASDSREEFSASLDWALQSVLIIGVPAAIGLVMLAGPLLATLFRSGQFTSYDVEMARLSLMAYGVGLPSFMLIKVLASGFYSRQNIKTPVRIAVVAVVVNMLLNLCLIVPLKHAGLALATGLASSLNALLLYRGLRRQGIYRPQRGWGRFVLQMCLGNGALVAFLWFGSGNLAAWLRWGSFERVGHLAIVLPGAMVAYFVCLWAGGMRFKRFYAPMGK